MASAVKSAAKSASKAKPAAAAKSSAKPAAKPAKAAPGNGKSAPAKAVKPASAKAEAQVNAKQPVKAKSAAKAKDAAAKPDASAKAAKPKKQKLVRDSFTMPESEYALLGEVKKACLANGYAVKKSELLRVGVALIRTLDNASLKNWIASLPPLKPGRPRKEKQGA